MFAIGLTLCIFSLITSEVSVFVLIDGFSTYFWQEPTLILLLFGSLAALAYFQKSTDFGDEVGIAGLGYCYANGCGTAKNVKKAIEIWKRAEHYHDCQYRLGNIYYYELKQYSEAKKYCLAYLATLERKNIVGDNKNGFMNANFCLGYIYSQERFYETALEYYRVAADYGDATAMRNIGVFYERGFGVEKDLGAAKYWYARARENGYKDSK